MAAVRNTALVIGNGDYQFATRLESPHGDAVAMASLLERLGFDVVAGFDCDFHDFERRLRDFQDRIDPTGVAVFYYSGHGVAELGEANHLLPVDAKVLYRDDLGRVTIPLDDVLTAMREAARVSLLFLDACRDDPFSGALVSGALGEMRSKRVFLPKAGLVAVPKERLNQALIAFAAEEGEVAQDGDGRSLSPFTAALVQHLGSPGQEIRSVMTEVRRDVRTATANKQTPWSKESLTEDFVLVPRAVDDIFGLMAPRVPGGGGGVLRNPGQVRFLPDIPRAAPMAAPPQVPDGRDDRSSLEEPKSTLVPSTKPAIVKRRPMPPLPWLFAGAVVLVGVAGAVFSFGFDSEGLCDKTGLGIVRACLVVPQDDIADLNSTSFAVAANAANHLVEKRSGGDLTDTEKRDLAQSLVVLVQPGALAAMSLNGQRGLFYVLSQIPATTWLEPTWIDLLAQTHQQIAELDLGLRSGSVMLAPDSLTGLFALKANIGYVDRATLTVYFQFAGYTRTEAEAFQSNLFKESQWSIPGVEREEGAVGLNEVRYGDPKMQALAMLLAHDLTVMTGKTVMVAEIEPTIPALHLEIWISR